MARWDIGQPVDDAVGLCDDVYVLMQSVESPKFNESGRLRAPELCRADAQPRHANGFEEGGWTRLLFHRPDSCHRLSLAHMTNVR